jgi:arylsulfatase A-like enzyme
MRVLLLDIDGLQPAYLGPYGCEWVPTPTLDRWAADGVVFDFHFADSPGSASWRSGRHPLAGGAAGRDLIADLRAVGVRTARVGPTPDAGWDIEVVAERATVPLALAPTRRAVRQAIEQLGDAADALLRVELDALTPPWRPTDEALADCFADEEFEPWTDALPGQLAPDDDATFLRVQTTYAAAVSSLDAALAKLLDDCAKRGWGDDTLWLLTAGRGFPLGEHGPVGFGNPDVHEELVHLPLMVRWPHAEHAGHRVAAVTQPMDLAPTLRDLFGLPADGGDATWAGRSLAALARGGDTPVREWAVSGVGSRWGYRTPGWYLMLDDVPDGPRRLFVKPDDRWEVNDVWSRNQELTEELEAEFRKLLPPSESG